MITMKPASPFWSHNHKLRRTFQLYVLLSVTKLQVCSSLFLSPQSHCSVCEVMDNYVNITQLCHIWDYESPGLHSDWSTAWFLPLANKLRLPTQQITLFWCTMASLVLRCCIVVNVQGSQSWHLPNRCSSSSRLHILILFYAVSIEVNWTELEGRCVLIVFHQSGLMLVAVFSAAGVLTEV